MAVAEPVASSLRLIYAFARHGGAPLGRVLK
jgi:hypothetical protein